MTRRSRLRCGVDISVRREVPRSRVPRKSSWDPARRGAPGPRELVGTTCRHRWTWLRCAPRGSGEPGSRATPSWSRARSSAASSCTSADRGTAGPASPASSRRRRTGVPRTWRVTRGRGSRVGLASLFGAGGARVRVLRLRDARVLQRDVLGRRAADTRSSSGRGSPPRVSTSTRVSTAQADSRARWVLSRAHDGADLTGPPIYLCGRTKRPRIVVTPRVGVAYAGEWADRPWRFLDPSSAHVSKPPRKAIGRGR